MLYKPEPGNPASVPYDPPRDPVRTLTGRRLNRLIKGVSAKDRALLAYRLAHGLVQLTQPTYRQAAALAHVSHSYVARVSRLTDEERLRLTCSLLSLSRLHNRKRDLSDAELDHFVKRVGVERVWAALDRYTQPALFPAE